MVAGEAVPFDWCSFYALFWNDKGIKCKINLPDTVLFRFGQLSAWWHTSKEGYVQRHTSQSTSIEAIRKRFLAVAQQDAANYSKFVCVSWLGSGKPQLLRVMAFNQLCELLSDRLESGRPDTAPEIETPTVLQAFVQPWQDLRYVTTYINSGTSVACHTFQRKYSRRYTPMSAATAGQLDARDADIIIGDGPDAEAQRAAIDEQQGAVEPSLKMALRKLTAHIVKYIQRAHGLTLGGIVCEFIRDADGKIFLMSVLRTEWSSNMAGHGANSLSTAALRGPIEELSERNTGSVVRESASNTRVRTPDPHIQLQTDAWDIMEDDGEEEGAQGGQEEPGEHHQEEAGDGEDQDVVPSNMGPRLTATGGWSSGRGPQRPASGSVLQHPPPKRVGGPARPQSAMPLGTRAWSPAGKTSASQPPSPVPGGAATFSPLADFPGKQGKLGGLGVSVSNTWPSLQHDVTMSPKTLGQGMAATGSSAGSRPAQPSPAPRATLSRPASCRPASSTSPSPHISVRPRTASPGAAPGGAPLGFGSTTHRTSHVVPDRPYSAQGVPGVAPSEFAAVPGSTPPPPLTGVLTAQGLHVNSGVRGSPLVIAHLQKEVEALRDQLLYQHALAEANAAKVRQLERESAVSTAAFDSRKRELEQALAMKREEASRLAKERDNWRERAEAAEAAASEATSERESLEDKLSAERETTLAALRQYQDQVAAERDSNEQLQSEVERLSTALKVETTAVNSLKRQLLEFAEIAERNKATLRDQDMDPGLQDVLTRTGYLLAGQTNPTGEQYSVQKVLQHYSSDLRAIFLFYCQLETAFAEHWPPSMTFPAWMLFCRDSETSDPRAGARVRSNQHFKMLQPSACEELFSKFSSPDAQITRQGGKAELVLTYESFLCCVMACASALRRPELQFLSEALREFILRYMSRAKKVMPQGMGRGALRSAIEGTRASPSLLASAAAAAGGGDDVRNGSMPDAGPAPPPSTATSPKKLKRAKSARHARDQPPPAAASAGGRLSLGGQAVGNSAVMKELALLSLSGPKSSNGRDVVRTGGGFAVG